jgi:hypothetical protein
LDAPRVDAAPARARASREGRPDRDRGDFTANGETSFFSATTTVEIDGEALEWNLRSTRRALRARSLSSMRGFPSVPHVRQTHSWDCGLACALMALRALTRRDGSRGELEIESADADADADADARAKKKTTRTRTRMPATRSETPETLISYDLGTLRRRCATRSVWTIDLAHLLRSFEGLDVVFYTVTVGVNAAFQEERFYKASIAEDEKRVEALFRRASESGILVRRMSVSSRDLKRWAESGEWIMIALVDKRALAAEGETRTGLAAEIGAPSSLDDTGYTGHYVVVCGYDASSDSFAVRDPASRESSAVVSAAALDRARKAFGTDEDLLLVRRSPTEGSREEGRLA